MQRLDANIYKGYPDAQAFHAKLEEAARSLSASIRWQVPSEAGTIGLRTFDDGDIHKVFLDGPLSLAEEFYRAVGRVTGLPWLNARIPGAPVWLYTLYLGDKEMDSFNPCPEMWEDPEALSEEDLRELIGRWPGNAPLLAQLWNVPAERIERYLRPWGLKRTGRGGYKFKLSGKAYPEDESGYGSERQLIDFWRALGIKNTFGVSERHSLTFTDVLPT